MIRTALAALLATATAAACNPLGTNPAPAQTATPAATPTTLPVSAGLCRTYDRALKPMEQARDYINANQKKGVYALIVRDFAEQSRDRLKTATELATGPTRDAVIRTSAEVQTVIDKLTDYVGSRKAIDLVPEFESFYEATGPIADACEAAGTALKTDL